MIAFDRGPAQELDAVIAAAILAFGFVYIHPFEDGNGRIHRYLIHHVLARARVQSAGRRVPGLRRDPGADRRVSSRFWKATRDACCR